MSNNKHITNEKEIVCNAVANLLDNQSAKEHLEGLNALLAGYMRSDFAEIKEDRLHAMYVYENFRDLLTRFQELENNSRFELIQNLQKGNA